MTVGGVVLPALTLEITDLFPSNAGGYFDGYTSGNNNLMGRWGGKFYSNGASAADPPGSVAGTFGASRFVGDDLGNPFESFVGTFAAYKQ